MFTLLFYAKLCAADWILLGEKDNIFRGYVDIDSITINGSERRVWIMNAFEDPKTVEELHKKAYTEKILMTYSCEKRTSRRIMGVYYSKEGDHVGSSSFAPEMIDVVPDTTEDRAYKLACSFKTEKEKAKFIRKNKQDIIKFPQLPQ